MSELSFLLLPRLSFGEEEESLRPHGAACVGELFEYANEPREAAEKGKKAFPSRLYLLPSLEEGNKTAHHVSDCNHQTQREEESSTRANLFPSVGLSKYTSILCLSQSSMQREREGKAINTLCIF